MSTKPGATTSPPASMVRAAGSSVGPIEAMRPSRTPTSARRAGPPVPSTTVPPRMRRSSTDRFLPLCRGQGMAEQAGRVQVGHGGHLVGRQAVEAPGEELLGVGPARVGVRVVALHHDVVDADPIADPQRGRVVDAAEPEVALHGLAWRDVAVPRTGAADAR